jgi:hypothetical protein
LPAEAAAAIATLALAKTWLLALVKISSCDAALEGDA